MVNKGLNVVENGLSMVTKDILDANDMDTDDQELLFTLVSDPKYGRLQYKSVQIPIGIYNIENFSKRYD